MSLFRIICIVAIILIFEIAIFIFTLNHHIEATAHQIKLLHSILHSLNVMIAILILAQTAIATR
jgi:hypothetical protein